MTPAHILIVEDERHVALSIQHKLERLGYTVAGTVATGKTAIKQAAHIRPDLILMDIMLGGPLDSIATTALIRKHFDIPVVYLMAYSDDTILDRARLNEPYSYVLKPFESKELQMAIEIALYKKTIKQQLQEKEQWLSTISNNIGDAVIATNKQGDITFMNPVAERLTGWSETEGIGKPLAEVFQVVNENDQQPIADLASRVIDSQQTVILDHGSLLIQRNGQARPIEDSAAFIVRQQDAILGILIVFHDVTDRKQAEQALQASEEKYRTLFENSPDAITLLDLNGVIVDCNEATSRQRGQPKQEIIGKPFMEIEALKKEDLTHYAAAFSQVLQGKKIGPVIVELNDARNQEQWLEAFPVLLFKDGRVNAIQVISRDITQRKLAEEAVTRYQELLEELVTERTAELEIVIRQLAQSNAELEQFAYVASHDLREPLRKIKSYTELLAKRYEGQLDSRADKYIDYIVDGAARMQELITDLLAYSRLGRTELNLDLVPITKILGGVMNDLELTIQESGAIITADPLPTLTVDAQQIGRLLQNLLGNALKFCEAHPPKIHISAQEGDDEWQFGISDNGIGIEARYAERIFLIFQRLHTQREYPGTGMGLAICKKIVENHNGRIWVESEQAQGTTFYFTLPIKQEGRFNTGLLRRQV